MNKLLAFLFSFLIPAIGFAAAPAQKFHEITRVVGVLTNSSVFLVSTQDATGRWRTRTIDLPTLGTNVSQWATGALGGGVSQVQYTNSVTNTDLRRIFLNALTTTNPIQSSGGNARHSTAVDLQTYRNDPSFVASGALSGIHGGSNNLASGIGSTVIGGVGNMASGLFSIAGGSGSIASDSWSIALGFDNFSTNGSDYAISIGGTDNHVINSIQSSIFGGGGNIISNGAISSILGSENSRIWGDYGLIVGGSDNVASNTFATAIGDRNRSLAHYGMTIGHYLTNTEPYAIKLGFGTTPITISSNGLTRILGSLDATNLVTFRAQNDTLTLDPGANNASSLNFSQNDVELYDIFAASDAGSLRFREGGATAFQISGGSFRSIKSASFDTNATIAGTNISRWLKLDGGQTASRALVLDSNTNVVAATGTPDGTKFLRDDNTYAVPPGGSGGPTTSNNIPFITYTADTGSPKTNIIIDASLGTVFRVLLTNNMGLIITNGSDAQDLSIELYQDGTGNRTVTHVPATGGQQTNNWQFGEDITSPITLTTNRYKKDLLKLRYEVTNLATNTSRSNWCVIGMLRKYPNP